MNYLEHLHKELISEAEVTRRYLSIVPFEKAEFRPAEKSESLGRLAIHVAEIIGWWTACLKQDKLDFIDFKPKSIDTSEGLLNYFDDLFISASQALSTANIAELDKDWSMTYGEQVLFTLPKHQVLRTFCMNHLVHHRAQLGVYLRLLNIPIPAVYGPSADDKKVTLITDFRDLTISTE